MRVIVTGGHGFLGRRVVRRLVDRLDAADVDEVDEADEVVVVDVVEAPPVDERVRTVVTDITRPGALDPLLDRPEVAIIHLASMVSAEAEVDWSGAVATNIGALVELLESCRRAPGTPRLTFASSVAVFGGPPAGRPVGDTTRLLPRSTYGMTKAVGELLIDDATRRGIVDGRCPRLPTVIVRPGAPNRAASSFASGLFREPLAGVEAVVPVPLSTRVVVIGTETATDGLLAVHDLASTALGEIRSLNLPGLAVSVADMGDTLGRVGGPQATALLRHEVDPTIEAVVGTWPHEWDDERARGMGLPADPHLDAIVQAYAAEVAGSVS